MQIQQLKEQADRAVTVDVFDNTEAASLIPSIRQAVSDCAGYMTIAEQKAGIASDKAELATQKAQIASDKAAETVNTLSGKAEKDLSNLTITGKKNLFSMLQPKGTSLVNIFEAYITSVQQTFSAPANGELFLLMSKGASNTVSLYKNNVLVDIFGEASTAMTIFSFKDIAEKDDVYSIATDQSSVGVTLSRFTILAGEN